MKRAKYTMRRAHSAPVPTIARRRREVGLPQTELAAIVGVKTPVLCRIEVGDREPTPELAQRIEFALQAYEVARYAVKARLAEAVAS